MSCTKNTVEKPSNLISKENMINIIYDLSLLEAIRTQAATVSQNYAVKPNAYIYKKYKIDSLQFANSNQYYASQIDSYKELYNQVNLRLEANLKMADSTAKVKGEKAENPESTTKKAPVFQGDQMVK